MKKLSYEELLSQRKNNEEALSASRHPISLMLDNIRSLHNVGSIFRTADSALIQKLYLCGYTPHPPRDEISKTALGADSSVPWHYEKNICDAIVQLKSSGTKVIAVELTDKKRLYTDLTIEDFPLCLVLGNELSGISTEALALCDSSIEIPMYGVKHSLNVSVACGICTFEAVKIWNHINSNSAHAIY